MHAHRRPRTRPLLLLGLLPVALAACDKDALEIAREVEQARGDCTQEKLKQGDEECVQMMERYADMGVDAIQTYIGAIQSLDEALRRMPAPHFDTAGLGRALTLPAEETAAGGLRPDLEPEAGSAASAQRAGESWYGDGAAAAGTHAAPSASFGHRGERSPERGSRGGWNGAWGLPAAGAYPPGYGPDPRGARSDARGGWGARGYAPPRDPGYGYGYGDHGPYRGHAPSGVYGGLGGPSHGGNRGYGPSTGHAGYGASSGYGGYGPSGWTGGYDAAGRYGGAGPAYSRGHARGVDPRSPDDRRGRAGERGAWDEPPAWSGEEPEEEMPEAALDAPPPPPERGVLLPPDQRLRRPWIRRE